MAIINYFLYKIVMFIGCAQSAWHCSDNQIRNQFAAMNGRPNGSVCV